MACAKTGQDFGVAIIGDNSCNSNYACDKAGYDEISVTIGSNSCNAYKACVGASGNIGSGTCNTPCECHEDAATTDCDCCAPEGDCSTCS